MGRLGEFDLPGGSMCAYLGRYRGRHALRRAAPSRRSWPVPL